ncbi:MAG: catalase, partial [Lachnospiraceae bacterium]|nr:catalase [Lachnospiraceae bacterium]
DYSAHAGDGIIPARMPDRYVVEMFIDRVAASKNYNRKNYSDDMPLKYYQSGNSENFIHPDTRRKLEKLLHMLAEHGEAYTMRYIRTRIIPKIRKQGFSKK